MNWMDSYRSPDPRRPNGFQFTPADRPGFGKDSTGKRDSQPGSKEVDEPEVGAQQKSAWDVLAKTSLAGMLAVNTTMLFSPAISKAAARYIESGAFQKSALGEYGWMKGFMDKVANRNPDNKNTFLPLLTRLNAYTALVQLNTGYQVGLNTQQPSKSLSSFMGTLTQLATIIKSDIPYVQTLSYLSSFFWFSGETNDIKNNNNPGQRREWDQRRLFRAWKKEKNDDTPELQKEVKGMLSFMGKDFKYTLSFAPWKNLIESIRNKEDLKKPQPYQTAIGAQLNLLAFFTATACFATQVAIMLKNPNKGLKLSQFSKWPDPLKVIPNRISRVTKGVMLFSIISYLPVLMRALQSKGESDGILTVLGVPLITGGQVLKGHVNLNHWQGLFSMGGPVVNEGKRLNSKKYRAQVVYLTNLHEQAMRNPALKASDVLADLRSHPEKLKQMKLSMGNVRVEYILKLLQTGVEKQRLENLNFADYLLPIMKMGA